MTKNNNKKAINNNNRFPSFLYVHIVVRIMSDYDDDLMNFLIE
jgi:hypothetical protein